VVHLHQCQAGLKHVEFLGKSVAYFAFFGHVDPTGINSKRLVVRCVRP
jgi:hypothetical protein